MKKLRKELEDRWLLYQLSSDDLFEKFDSGNWKFYCGFDPTASSLHLWNFIGFMVWVHLMMRWNKFTALTGGATGMIWDPGGKDAERNFLSEEDLNNNQKAISNQISSILKNLEGFTWKKLEFDFVNNKDFYKDMWYLDFLREVWKYITVNNMVAKDTVKKRIEDPSKSISYTEFSYMLLQGYDFVKLFKDSWVELQIWGQDQWWNLVTWTQLIRKKYDKQTNVLTWPLITDASWKKFGKSEWNAIWLDKSKTSPYEIYQYFMNVSDEDIARYLKMLTLIDTEEIDKIVRKHMENPWDREWQKVLSYSVVEIIHWKLEADLALKISDFMFGNSTPHPNTPGHLSLEQSSIHLVPLPKGEGTWKSVNKRNEILRGLNDSELETFKNAMWWLDYNNENLFEIIVGSGLSKSNSEARQAVKSWAININEEKISDFNYDFSWEFINDKVLLLRKGKKNFRLIIK